MLRCFLKSTLIIIVFPEALNTVFQQVADAGAAEISQAVERKLDKYSAIGFGIRNKQLVFVNPLTRDHADGRAAVTPFYASKAFQVSFIAVIVVNPSSIFQRSVSATPEMSLS